MKKKIVSLLVLLTMLIGILPTSSVFAASYPSGKKFDMKKDGWSFTNDPANFGAGSTIPEKTWIELFGDKMKNYSGHLDFDNGGKCYGMVAYAAAIFAGYETLDDKYDNVNAVGATQDGRRRVNDNKIIDKINKYHLLRYSHEFDDRPIVMDYNEVLRGIKAGETFIVDYKYRDFQHSLLVDTAREPEELKNGKYRIYLYDPNYPYMENLDGIDVTSKLAIYPKHDGAYVDLDTKKNEWKIVLESDSEKVSGHIDDEHDFKEDMSKDKELKFEDVSWLKDYKNKKATLNRNEVYVLTMPNKNTEGDNIFWVNFDKNQKYIESYNAICAGWAKNEIEKAISNDLVPEEMHSEDFTININRKQFAAIAVKLYEKLSGDEIKAGWWDKLTYTKFDDMDLTKEYKEYVIKASKLNLIAGIKNDDGTHSFKPDDEITRQDMALILTRVYKKVYEENADITVEINDSDRFKDDKLISDYAKNAVYFMAKKGILKGDENNNFAPKDKDGGGNTTSEAAIVVAYRCLSSF